LTNVGRDTEEIIADMYEVSVEAVVKAGLSMKQMSSWGIGMPSYVNPKTHLLVRANNFGWVNLPIIDYLKKYTDLDIYIDNDANCAALGETLAGVAKDYNDTLMLTIGTGLGGGIIMDKKIYSGSDKMGAELGHTKLVYDGIRCSCGQKGCAESYCSTTALVRQMREALEEDKKTLVWRLCDMDLSKIDGKMIFSAAYQNDILALKIINQFVDYLSYALSSFITIFRPEVVIIGGGLAESGDLLFDLLKTKTYENTFAAKEIGIPESVPAKLGNDAGIIGAALLQLHSDKR
jgi:glucokinase